MKWFHLIVGSFGIGMMMSALGAPRAATVGAVLIFASILGAIQDVRE